MKLDSYITQHINNTKCFKSLNVAINTLKLLGEKQDLMKFKSFFTAKQRVDSVKIEHSG